MKILLRLIFVCGSRYVAIYFSTLYTRYNTGTVTDEMLAFPKTPFIIIGFLEALGVVAGMYSGGMRNCGFAAQESRLINIAIVSDRWLRKKLALLISVIMILFCLTVCKLCHNVIFSCLWGYTSEFVLNICSKHNCTKGVLLINISETKNIKNSNF